MTSLFIFLKAKCWKILGGTNDCLEFWVGCVLLVPSMSNAMHHSHKGHCRIRAALICGSALRKWIFLTLCFGLVSPGPHQQEEHYWGGGQVLLLNQQQKNTPSTPVCCNRVRNNLFIVYNVS